METNLKTQILERKAYIAGLDKFIPLPENNEVFNFSKEDFDSEMRNDRVSNDVNTFYTSSLRGLYFFVFVFQSYMKLMSYIIYNRQSEIGNDIFTRDYVVLPLSYKEIYQMLITLPKLEADRIIAKMNLSVNTINNLITAFKEKSEELFIACLEKERKFPILGCPLLDGRQQAPV